MNLKDILVQGTANLKVILYNGIIEGNLELAYQMLTWNQAIEKAIKKQEEMEKDIHWLKAKNCELKDELKGRTRHLD